MSAPAATADARPATPSPPAVEPSTTADGRPESCVKYFDALWFCYSPGHQLRQYYRYGNVDDCTTTWAQLWACLGKRTRAGADAAAASAPARPHHPLWTLRTREEARAAWEAEFGAVDEQQQQQH